MHSKKLEFCWVNPKDLSLSQKPVRKHSKLQMKLITSSIKKFGIIEPLIIDENNVIINGEARLRVALDLGLDKIPVIKATNFSNTEKEVLACSLNKLVQKGGWNSENLITNLKHIIEIKTPEIKIEYTGFTLTEANKIIFPSLNNEASDLDYLDLSKIEQRVQIGDIWDLGQHKLVCANPNIPENFEKLLQGEKADFVFSDFANYFKDIATNININEIINNIFQNIKCYMNVNSLLTIVANFKELNNIILTSKEYDLQFIQSCIWDTKVPITSEFYDDLHELVLFYKTCDFKSRFSKKKKKSSILRYKANQFEDFNHVIPSKFIEDILCDFNFGKNNIILDPIAGVGSTLIASEKLGISSRVMELSPNLCDVILFRFENLTKIKATKVAGGNYVI